MRPEVFHRFPRRASVLFLLLGGLSFFARAAGADSIQVVSRADPQDPSFPFPSVTANADSFISDLPQSVPVVRTSMSADGRFIAILSSATDLIPGLDDQNQTWDVFLYDRQDGSMTLVTRKAGSPLTTVNGFSSAPVISADGRFVAFTSVATDLTPRTDTYQTQNVDLYDRTTKTVSLVSRALGSPLTGGNDFSGDPAISDDGRYVSFWSEATNLVPEQITAPTIPTTNIFLFDRVGGTTTLVSRAAGGATSGNNSSTSPFTMSGDGRYIAYVSQATDLVPGGISGSLGAVFLYDRRTGANTLVSRSAALEAQARDGYNPVISHDGNRIAYESAATDLVPGQIDTNGTVDAFLYDREHGNTILVSRSTLSPVTTGNCSSFLPYPDARGRHVAFQSCATDLAPAVDDGNGTLDVFLFTLDTGKIDLVSHSANSLTTTGDDFSDQPVISGNGRYVAYRSEATNLVSGQIDSPYSFDVFLYDRESRQTTLVSHALGSPQQAGSVDSEGPGLTPNGQYLVFVSSSGDLVERDFNGAYDVFLLRHPGGEDDDH
jgi:Tol biopolymer transport system component